METSMTEGTFIVKIKHCQNSTWQGSVNWVNNQKEVPFRSALELVSLLDSAMDGKVKFEETQA